MSLKQRFVPDLGDGDGRVLDQLAGVTGLGWTASVLGFLTTVVGYGNGLVADPHS